MSATDLNQFLSGAFVAVCAAVIVFFWRYYRKTRERLFVILAISFSLLGIERSVLAFVWSGYEGRHLIFVARLAAFLLIIAAIIDKNRPRRGRTR